MMDKVLGFLFMLGGAVFVVGGWTMATVYHFNMKDYERLLMASIHDSEILKAQVEVFERTCKDRPTHFTFGMTDPITEVQRIVTLKLERNEDNVCLRCHTEER